MAGVDVDSGGRRPHSPVIPFVDAAFLEFASELRVDRTSHVPWDPFSYATLQSLEDEAQPELPLRASLWNSAYRSMLGLLERFASLAIHAAAERDAPRDGP